MRSLWSCALCLAMIIAPAAIHAGGTAPNGPHPRLFLDQDLSAQLKALARQDGSAVAKAVADCGRIQAHADEFARDGYMGLDWARSLQTCLVAWAATGQDQHAQTALIYFRALIDDLQNVGDGKGGDGAATRDSGYAIRAHGPYTALAYDWLHDHKGMDDALRQRARQRFKAWTDWYAAEGYRARSPGTNYHAGYVLAATLIAITQAGDAGDDGERLWRTVADQIFAHDLVPAARDGVLVGGDWGEGWQYAPLSVAEYALAARAVANHGVDVAPFESWLQDIALRHIYALMPSGKNTYAVGDTQAEEATIPVRRFTLDAVILGPSPLQAKQWAQAEIERIGTFADGDLGYLLFDALAEAQKIEPVAFPKARAATAYFAPGISTLYARSNWSAAPIWFAAHCSRTVDIDHMHPNAGNFVLSRGVDDIIVDPSPYGTLSSMTSNAPTIASTVLPKEYLPSQAFWSTKTGFRWKFGIPGGGLVARCDYADQYAIQSTPSDIPLAYRDFVLLPYDDGHGGEAVALLIADRARGQTPEQSLYLRFRTQARTKPIEGGASGQSGASALSIRKVYSSEGRQEWRRLDHGDCFDDKRYTRGNCDAARFDIDEVKLVVPGPKPEAMTLIEAGPAGTEPVKGGGLEATGGTAWLIERGTQRWIVTQASGKEAVSYEATKQRTVHVVLPAAAGGTAKVRVASVSGESGCTITVGGSSGVELDGAPAVFATGDDCALKPEPRSPVPAGIDVLRSTGAAASGTDIKPAGPA